ncbi:hypothetical protein BTVI_130610 [Pitangus sulphuratus]|nr:hypothetical protein BTVI_130610 [Pitangus sulphuratus]
MGYTVKGLAVPWLPPAKLCDRQDFLKVKSLSAAPLQMAAALGGRRETPWFFWLGSKICTTSVAEYGLLRFKRSMKDRDQDTDRDAANSETRGLSLLKRFIIDMCN